MWERLNYSSSPHIDARSCRVLPLLCAAIDATRGIDATSRRAGHVAQPPRGPLLRRDSSCCASSRARRWPDFNLDLAEGEAHLWPDGCATNTPQLQPPPSPRHLSSAPLCSSLSRRILCSSLSRHISHWPLTPRPTLSLRTRPPSSSTYPRRIAPRVRRPTRARLDPPPPRF